MNRRDFLKGLVALSAAAVAAKAATPEPEPRVVTTGSFKMPEPLKGKTITTLTYQGIPIYPDSACGNTVYLYSQQAMNRDFSRILDHLGRKRS